MTRQRKSLTTHHTPGGVDHDQDSHGGGGGGSSSGSSSNVSEVAFGSDELEGIRKEAEQFPEGPRRDEALEAANPSKWDTVITHRDGDGNLVGIASVWEDADFEDREGMPKGQYVKVRNLATSRGGEGASLLNSTKEYAQRQNAGIYLDSLSGSVGFYEKQGMHNGLGLSYYLTAEEVATTKNTRNARKVVVDQRPPGSLFRDPTRTLMLRKRFFQAFSKRFARMKGEINRLLVDEDVMGMKRANKIPIGNKERNDVDGSRELEEALQGSVQQRGEGRRISGRFASVNMLGSSAGNNLPTLNTRWAFRNSGEKLRLFQEWLAETLGETLLDSAAEEAYWEAFVADGYAKGAGRSFDQVMAKKPRFGPGEGQFFAGAKSQFLAESFTSPIAVERVKLIAGRVFTDLKDITDTMSTQMSRVLADGLAQGMSPREVARKMNTQVDLGRARSLRVARTETVRAHAEGQLDSLERLGVEEVGVAVEWSTSKMGVTALGNPSPCPLCAPLQGVVMKLKEARGLLPRHPNSLVGESVVKASGVVALVEATYTGNLVTITTSSGKTVTTTENHIHLTQFGFLQAKFLQQGMNLLDASKGYSMGSLVDHNDTGVTSIANVFKTLSPFASIELREPRAMDFHGDGESMHEEVRIIKTDGILWDQLQTKLGSVSVEEMFPLIDFVKDYRTLATESPSTTFLKSVASTFDSSMGLCRDSLSLLLGCLTQPESSGLGLSTGADSVSFKSPSDDTTTTTKMLRDCLNAHPFLKQFNDLVDWDNCLVPLRSIPRDTQNVQTSFDGVTLNPESFGQGSPSLPSLIALDQIVNVRIEHVESLPVYDMQTQSSLIIADGVTMSQCMCSYIPANVGETREQKKTQKSIRGAVKASVRAEKGKGSLAKKRRQSSWQGADLKPSKVRPKPFV